MIASLHGTVAKTSNGQVVLDVQSVGYLVHVSPQTQQQLTVGERAFFHTSLVVREDSMTIFGFLEPEELEFFDLLRSVNGIGPKSALAVLSELSVSQISEAVSNEADSVFKSVPGIGSKTAKLIVLTLAGKVVRSTAKGENAYGEQTIQALVGLGWSERQARRALALIPSKSKDEKQLLKEALKILSEAANR